MFPLVSWFARPVCARKLLGGTHEAQPGLCHHSLLQGYHERKPQSVPKREVVEILGIIAFALVVDVLAFLREDHSPLAQTVTEHFSAYGVRNGISVEEVMVATGTLSSGVRVRNCEARTLQPSS